MVDMMKNRFTGALPDGGMRAMLALKNFKIDANMFTGMLPESVPKDVKTFEIGFNRFAGSLPILLLIRMKKIRRLVIEYNRITGAWNR
eukprot:6166886-Amphidinium_carterae.1